MATPAQRFQGWIDSLSRLWSERFGNWLGRFIGAGIIGFADLVGKKFSKPLTPLIQRLIATGKIPPELQPLFDELLNPSGEIAAMLGTTVSNAMIGGALSRIIDAFFLPMSYGLNQATRNVVLSPDLMFSLERRNLLKAEYVDDIMEKLGYDKGLTSKWREMHDTYYSVQEAINLRRRGKISEGYLDTTLKAHGYTEGQLSGLKELALIIPQIQDLIRMAVKEAFTPEIAEKFGQYQDFPEAVVEWGEKQGLSREWLTRYWASHWDLPSVSQAFEMLHRGVITSGELTLLLRALDIMPYWREKLTEISYSPYTRVDARRMWDMGVLNDEQLLKSYKDEGYDEERAKNLVLWTKVYVQFPDLIARYKNGYIKIEEVRSALLAMGMPADRADWLIETKVKVVSADRTTKEKDLTKAEIVKGVKKGVLSEADAIELLQDMGYDAKEAKYIMSINMPEEDTKKALAQKELSKSDILSALKKELITVEDALSKLILIRYTADDAQFLINLALATAKPIVDVKQREITKTEIIKGVKLGVLTPEEAYLWLQDIGYSPDDASFILTISIPATTASPDSYTEFKQITQSYRESQGLKAKSIPLELSLAERDLIAAKAAFESGKKSKLAEDKMLPLARTLSEAEAKYRALLMKYKSPQ
jgi:hypothetical protein